MNFYVTFGQKYRYDSPHGGHPDGWFRIVAEDKDKAREIAFDRLGPQWAMLYDETEFDSRHFPLGELKLLP